MPRTIKGFRTLHKKKRFIKDEADGEWRLQCNVVEDVLIIALLKTSCFVCPEVIKQLEFYITLVKINKEHIWVSHRFSH